MGKGENDEFNTFALLSKMQNAVTLRILLVSVTEFRVFKLTCKLKVK